MDIIKNKRFPNERDLYRANNVHLIDCSFDGIKDGESALKEASNIILENCFFNLRYPLWHDKNIETHNIVMTDKCRAALWYSSLIKIEDSSLLGIKALRECHDIKITRTKIVSPEFGWKSHNIYLKDTSIESEYLFLEAKNLEIDNLLFKGKYSFQYVENLEITNSNLDTKDAFWHAKNVVVKDSIVKGEYLGWYSENLTFINCKIIGTQPLCYCKNLKLINCTTEAADFAFEYSEVDADIKGAIVSIKNPYKGKIVVDEVNEIILTDDSVYKHECSILLRKNNLV